MGFEPKKPIESAIINDVPDVIGVICGFIPSIVVMLRYPMDPIDRSWVSCGGISRWCEAFRNPRGECAGPARLA